MGWDGDGMVMGWDRMRWVGWGRMGSFLKESGESERFGDGRRGESVDDVDA